jgi:hypothetical protein
MSLTQTSDRLQLPESLRAQLLDFRRRVWSIKMAEAACAAVFSVIVSFLLMFALDRVWDTPAWPRFILFLAALLGCAIVPLALHRWVWRNRHLEQLARLLSRQHPHVGDQLLGIIELVRSDSEQARSRTLCEAAIQQVAADARKRDFRSAVPAPRHKLWVGLVTVPTVLALGLFAFFPTAVTNSWTRLLAPWKNTPRYTFAALEPLPGRMIVAHGEPFSITARLADETMWRPSQGVVRLGKQRAIAAPLRDGRYAFELPAQIDPGWVRVQIGDAVQRVHIEPTMRPELTSVVASITFPEYLGRTKPQQKDVRGGAISLVKGSRARFTATASRRLFTAQVDGKRQTPAGATIASPAIQIAASRTMEFRWQDEFGLASKEPFTLTITCRDDEAPSLICEDLPRQKVVLDSEMLTFKIKALDDFGIQRIGLQWQGAENPVVTNVARGERILAAGDCEKESLEVSGTFSAQSLGIEPQPVVVRVFAEDYFPGRPRVYSPAYTFYVLNAEQHAIWLTEQLSKWHRQSLDVRDRELQLHETNKQLRLLSSDELDRPETRRRIENQAMAEQANGRRLSNLVVTGEDLVRQAMRNPEFGVGHLEKWAEMLQILKDIASNRMPSVADLLKQAAQAPSVAANSGKGSPVLGNMRDSGGGKPSPRTQEAKKRPDVPQLVDRESSQLSPDKNSGKQEPKEGKPSQPRLGLLETLLTGKGGPAPATPPGPAGEKMDAAITQQQDLLAEFEKIADELNRVLANLEGSTLVKRLKAASRLQNGLGNRISSHLSDTFGLATSQVADAPSKVLRDVSTQEAKGSHDVSLIMDDMQTYFERRRFMRFKTVLDEMKKLDVIGSLRQLGDDLRVENGVSIAQCEYWCDTLDRWAEDLVDPTKSGVCPGGKTRSSLPPSLVLEALLILEAEVNLREETRVTEQARPAVAAEDHAKQAQKLYGTQDGVRERVDKLTGLIRELPDGESEFGYEIHLLGAVSTVMSDATEILARPETGGPAMGAETEAIELLLRSRRINPGAGGGGGPIPGGGGGGKTQDSALSLLGGGVNDKEVREDHGVSQATGETGSSLPEEFRAGLDEYFNRLERGPSGR